MGLSKVWAAGKGRDLDRTRDWHRSRLKGGATAFILAGAGLAVATMTAWAGAGLMPCPRAVFPVSSAEPSRHKVRDVAGLVVAVKPGELTIESKSGQTIRLITYEDYSDRVAVGAEVTASYYPQESGEAVLKSLDGPAESLFVPVGQIEQHIHRVVMMTNYQVHGGDSLSGVLRDFLQSNLHWYVAPQYLADEVRRKAENSKAALEAIDPSTGDFDLESYLAHSRGLVESMASATRSDAVLEADLVTVQAPVSRLVASWDGVQEAVAGPGMRALAKLSLFSHRGEVQAATVELKLWDAQGKLLWRNRRGLALLQVLEGRSNNLRPRPLSEYLANTPAIQAWLDAVFHSFVRRQP